MNLPLHPVIGAWSSADADTWADSVRRLAEGFQHEQTSVRPGWPACGFTRWSNGPAWLQWPWRINDRDQLDFDGAIAGMSTNMVLVDDTGIQSPAPLRILVMSGLAYLLPWQAHVVDAMVHLRRQAQ